MAVSIPPYQLMPNRIIREGILTSERVNSLDWEQEIFYRRLHSIVDDYGRYPAHPALLRAALYPLKLESVREANVQRLLASVEAARLVRLYEVQGKRYLEVLDFRQQVRAKDSKCPAPPSACVASAAPLLGTCAADAHSGVVGVEDEVDPPNPQRQSAGGGGGGEVFLQREEIWKRVCAIVGRDPKKPKSQLEMQTLASVEDVTAADMAAVERYATLCRQEPTKYTKPKALAHTLLEEFHAEVGKASAALKLNGHAPKKPGALPPDWPAFVDWLAKKYSLSVVDFPAMKKLASWELARKAMDGIDSDYREWRNQK